MAGFVKNWKLYWKIFGSDPASYKPYDSFCEELDDMEFRIAMRVLGRANVDGCEQAKQEIFFPYGTVV